MAVAGARVWRREEGGQRTGDWRKSCWGAGGGYYCLTWWFSDTCSKTIGSRRFAFSGTPKPSHLFSRSRQGFPRGCDQDASLLRKSCRYRPFCWRCRPVQHQQLPMPPASAAAVLATAVPPAPPPATASLAVPRLVPPPADQHAAAVGAVAAKAAWESRSPGIGHPIPGKRTKLR